MLNLKNLGKAIQMGSKAALLLAKKYSPEILTATGAAATVVGTVMACKATSKAEAILEEHNEVLDKIETVNSKPEEWKFEKGYTVMDYRKDKVGRYIKTGVQLTKLYVPAALTIAAGLSCIFGGHYILKKRNLALIAAYDTLDAMYKKYRKNVVEEFGEDVDRRMRLSLKNVEVVEKDENGKKVKKTVEVAKDNECPSEKYSDYARIFDDTNPWWSDDAGYNTMFLRNTERELSNKLRDQGYLYLNDAYKALGFMPTKAGQVVGWIYDPERKNKSENYLSIGLYEYNTACVNGYTPNCILDFNVDGEIWSKLPELYMPLDSGLRAQFSI